MADSLKVFSFSLVHRVTSPCFFWFTLEEPPPMFFFGTRQILPFPIVFLIKVRLFGRCGVGFFRKLFFIDAPRIDLSSPNSYLLLKFPIPLEGPHGNTSPPLFSIGQRNFSFGSRTCLSLSPSLFFFFFFYLRCPSTRAPQPRSRISAPSSLPKRGRLPSVFPPFPVSLARKDAHVEVCNSALILPTCPKLGKGGPPFPCSLLDLCRKEVFNGFCCRTFVRPTIGGSAFPHGLFFSQNVSLLVKSLKPVDFSRPGVLPPT